MWWTRSSARTLIRLPARLEQVHYMLGLVDAPGRGEQEIAKLLVMFWNEPEPGYTVPVEYPSSDEKGRPLVPPVNA